MPYKPSKIKAFDHFFKKVIPQKFCFWEVFGEIKLFLGDFWEKL